MSTKTSPSNGAEATSSRFFVSRTPTGSLLPRPARPFYISHYLFTALMFLTTMKSPSIPVPTTSLIALAAFPILDWCIVLHPYLPFRHSEWYQNNVMRRPVHTMLPFVIGIVFLLGILPPGAAAAEAPMWDGRKKAAVLFLVTDSLAQAILTAGVTLRKDAAAERMRR